VKLEASIIHYTEINGIFDQFSKAGNKSWPDV
jgi:hypothetical protein